MNNKNYTLDDAIFNFAYYASMHDATNQKAYDAEKKWLIDFQIDAVKIAHDLVKDFISKILNAEYINYSDKYNEDFFSLCKKICMTINMEAPKHINKNILFTFGNAQKLVNMAIKYIFICTYGNTNLKDNFKICHCPMDSIMLEHVCKEYYNLPDSLQKIAYTKTYFTKPWSNEELENYEDYKKSRYNDFQKCVDILSKKEDCSPLEYDFLHWH